MTWRAFFDRPWRRIAVFCGLGIVALLVVLRLFAMTPIAHSMVEARLEAMSVRGQQFELEGLSGDLLGRVSAEKFSIHDASGDWIDATEIEIAWAPLSLLFGDLKLKHIAAEQVHVQRRPGLVPSQSQSSRGFLTRVQLENLEVAELALAEGVAGPAQFYDLTGQLDATARTGDLVLYLEPIGTNGDQIQADITWGGEVLLEGQVQMRGAPGGLLSEVLGAPSGKAISGELDASGDPKNWSLNATGRVEQTEFLNLNAKLERGAYEADGIIGLGLLSRFDAIQMRLGDRVEFQGTLDAERRVQAEIQTDRGDLEFRGLWDRDGDAMALRDLTFMAASLDAERLAGVDALNLATLSAIGDLVRSANGFVFDGELFVPELAYDDYVLDGLKSVGRHEVNGGVLAIASSLEAQSVRGLPSGIQAYAGAPLTARVDADFDASSLRANIAALELNGEQFDVSGEGEFAGNGDMGLRGRFGVREVSVFQTIEGGWSAIGNLSDKASLKLDGSAVPENSDTRLAQLIGAGADFQIDLDRTAEGLLIQNAAVSSSALNGTLAGSVADNLLAIEGRMEADLQSISAQLSEPVSAVFSLRGPFGAPAFNVDLEGTYDDAPASATFAGKLERGIVQLSNIQGSWRDLSANGQGALNTSSPSESELEVIVAGSTPSIEAIDGALAYAQQTLSSDITLRGAQIGDADLRDGRLQLSGLWPEFEGRATYETGMSGLRLNETVSGEHPLTLNMETQTLLVSGASSIGENEIVFVAPAEVNFGSPLRASAALKAFDGAVQIEFDNSGQTLSRLTAIELDMGALGRLIQRPALLGSLSGEAQVQILEQGLDGQARIAIEGLSRQGLATQPANVGFDVEIIANAVSAKFHAADLAETLALDGVLITELSHQGTLMSITPSPDAAMPVRLQGGGLIAPIWTLAAPADLRLDGDFSLDVSNGDGRSFRFAGPVSIADGVFEDGLTGAQLENIDLQMELSPEAITLSSATARGANGGTISASGAYEFNGNSNIDLTLNRLRALKRGDVAATLSGDATVDRRNRRTHIEGDLNLDEMRVDLSKLPQAGYTTLDVTFADERENAAEMEPTREAISLDLKVTADRRLSVIGPSFESEWGLNARVRGSPGAPTLSGQASLVRGEASLLNRRFTLSEGTVRFAGAPEDSELYLRADRSSDGVTTSIEVAGQVTDPEITLSSDPSLPDDEVLARVLFGRSPSNLSPLQAAQLAGAAAQLAGGDALSLTGQLQEATGLDRLDFGVDDAGQATLATGKYLADDVYLEIESGGSGAPGVTLEWTPLDNVEVDAEIDPELGPKVAIQWKRDFDRLPGETRED